MKISIITAVYNRGDTIETTIRSVLYQQGVDVEYIVVDGNSTDETPRIIEQYRERIATIIREPDDGIYDALNKGISVVMGDVVGFIHADDWLADELTLKRVADALDGKFDVAGVYGDLVYVDGANAEQVKRVWRSGHYDVRKFRWGWMPPHPPVYLRRECYEQWGGFNLGIKTAADYELLVRMMVKHQIPMRYIPQVMVKMRTGGASNASVKNRVNANRDDRRAWVTNGLRPPLGLRVLKPLRKLPQYFWR